jgi:cytosine deaminase
MLVLSRQKNQSIVIGNDVEVIVVDVRGDKVRLGIQAPFATTVHRKEIYEAIRRENSAHGGNGAHPPDAAAAVAPAARDAFMEAAVEQAREGLAEGGLPIGAALVRNGQIVAVGRNRRVQDKDPMAHAEIDCLRRAGLQSTYADTTLYSTLTPCYLCSGAIVQFGVPRVMVADTVNFSGGADFLRRHHIDLTDTRDARCIDLMKTFIHEHPELWKEDIGK